MHEGEEPAAHAQGLAHDSLAEFLDGDYRRLVAGLALAAGCRAAAEDAVQRRVRRRRAQRRVQVAALTAARLLA
jgi:hypothetical protein